MWFLMEAVRELDWWEGRKPVFVNIIVTAWKKNPDEIVCDLLICGLLGEIFWKLV